MISLVFIETKFFYIFLSLSCDTILELWQNSQPSSVDQWDCLIKWLLFYHCQSKLVYAALDSLGPLRVFIGI